MSFWQNCLVLVTGGASFIGARLTDALVERGAKVRIVDDLSSGKLENIQQHLAQGTADNSLAKKLLGWEPQVPFREGLKRTIDWYFATKDREQVRKILGRMLTER